MEFEKIVMERYATKKFDGKKVPEDKIKKLKNIIRNSPSSYGLQPWKVMVVTDQATKEKLQPVSWNQPQITTCSHLFVLCSDKNVESNIDKLEKLMMKNGASQDSIKGYVDMMKGFVKGMDEKQKIAWAQRQVYIALGNALNGAKSLGFDSCPMEGFDSAAYSKILNLPSNLVPTVLCPVGYAADTPRPKQRFPESEVFI